MASLEASTDPFVSAVRATRMPMIITSPRLPDNPVIFTNNAFCRLTGYARHEIIGRNCRFLQGPETDPATVRRSATRSPAVEPIEIDIRNHRKDGTPFWNRLLLGPGVGRLRRAGLFLRQPGGRDPGAGAPGRAREP